MMLRPASESPQLIERPSKPVNRRPASESSFNLDTPQSPHFNQLHSNSLTNMSEGTNGYMKNGGASELSSSNGSFADKNPLTYAAGFSSGKDQDIYVFPEPPSKKLCCPVCSRVFNDPVITTCGHTFCKECVKKSANEICPIDKKSSKYIVDNIALSEQIGELQIHCKYGCKKKPDTGEYIIDKEGCPAIIKIAERFHHESDCMFAPTSCPNNPNCPQFPKKDLQMHLETCNSAVCLNHKYGCKYVDTPSNTEEHMKTCVYTNAGGSVRDKEGSSIELLIQENKSAREDIDFLFTSLRGLSQRFEQLEAEKDQLISHVNRMALELDEVRRDRQNILNELDHMRRNIPTVIAPPSGIDPDVIIKCKGTCVGHEGPVWCLAVNNDYLFSGSSDNHVKVWDIGNNYKCVKTLSGHAGIVLALTVYGKRLYSGSQDTKILVWNIENDFELEDTLDAHDNPVCTLASSKGLIFSGSLKTVKVWSVDGDVHTLKKEITGFNHWVRALYATDKELYCGSYQTIEIYNLDTLEETTALKTYGGSVYSICVTDKHILCGTYEKNIHVWELGTLEQVTTLQGHNGTVYALTWMSSPNGILVFSASYDRTIRVWSQTYMICKQTLIRHTGSVACLAVSKGRLFSGGIDSMVKVWQ